MSFNMLPSIAMCPRAAEHWNRRNEAIFLGKLTPLKSSSSVETPPLNRTYTIFENGPGGVDILVLDEKEPSFDAETFEDQKQFLQGFQVIETIDKILQSHNDGKDFLGDLDASFSKIIKKTVKTTPGGKKSPLSPEHVQTLAFFCEKLKLLLKEWSLTGLRKSCFVHVKELRRFVKTVADIAAEERNKLNLLLHNKQVDVQNIYFGKKQTLLRQLETHTAHWSQILQTVHRMINVFHLPWDSSLNLLLSRTQSTLAALLNEAFHWIYAILVTDYQVLVSNDQQIVPSDVLQNFYSTTESFVKLLPGRTWKSANAGKCATCTPSFNCAVCSVESFTYTYLMRILGHLQGNSAAGRVVDVLSLEMKRSGIFTDHGYFYWLASQVGLRPGTETSDYYSASQQSERSREVAPPTAPTGSFATALVTVFQAYQASLLKHLFALTCMQSLQPENPKPHEARRRRRKLNSAGRQTWSRTTFRSSIESSSALEKTFWSEFWKNMERHTLTLTWKCSGRLQKSGRLGTFSVLPCHLTTLVWKKFIGSDLSDMNPDVLLSMQRVFQQLIFHAELNAWDERFCSALSLTIRSRLSPVPLMDGTVGSNGGKVLCDALEPLIASVFTSKENKLLSMKVLLYLQCTVDHVINWSVIRQAAHLAGWNVSLFLLVGLSDLKRASEMLDILGDNWADNYPSLIAALGSLWKLPYQKSSLKVIEATLPKNLSRKTYTQSRGVFEMEMPPARQWRKKKKGEKHLYVLEIVSMILEPIIGTLVKLNASLQPSIMAATAEELGKAWIDVIQKKRLKFSVSGADHLKEDLHYIQSWISKSPSSEEARESFLNCSSFRRLNGMIHVLTKEVPQSRPPSGQNRNRVAPADDSISQVNAVMMITKEDRDSWEMLRARKSFFTCC